MIHTQTIRYDYTRRYGYFRLAINIITDNKIAYFKVCKGLKKVIFRNNDEIRFHILYIYK